MLFLLIAFLVFLLVLAGVIFCMQPTCEPLQWVCALFGVGKKKEVVEFFFKLASGWILMVGLFVAYQRSKAHLQEAQASTAGQQQGQFRDAIKHLGHKSASVRQGGIHALFQLALKQDDFRVAVAETLCAHLRGITQDKEYLTQHKNTPSAEVQSLLTLLFVEGAHGTTPETFWKGIRPNLLGCSFRGAELTGARFYKADLRGAQFQGARLTGAEFQGADLRYAQFQEAVLIRGKFNGALFKDARFQGAQFQGANLRYTQFRGVNLSRAQFQGVEFSFHGAQFQCADLSYAQFRGIDLCCVEFQGAALCYAQFQGANLSHVQFQGAKLMGANFQGAYTLDLGASSLEVQNLRRVSPIGGIRDRVGHKTKLSQVVFSGGLSDKQVERWVADLEKIAENLDPARVDLIPTVVCFLEGGIERFKKTMENHVGKDKSNELPKGVITGTYSEEKAEKWIAAYQDALAEDPPSNSQQG